MCALLSHLLLVSPYPDAGTRNANFATYEPTDERRPATIGVSKWRAMHCGREARVERVVSTRLASGKLGVVAYDRHSMAVIDGRVELWGRRGGAPKQGIAYAFL